jgi:transcriptional regulator with XRE-family HTH domain
MSLRDTFCLKATKDFFYNQEISVMVKEVLNKIRLARENKGLTQDFIAIQLDMTASNYAKIERGELPMTLEHLDIIAKTLKIKAADFFNAQPETANEDMNSYKIQPLSKEDLREIKQEIILELKTLLERSAGSSDHGAEL